MKKYDLVKLINDKKCIEHNLEKDIYGIVVDSDDGFCNVLFFDKNNRGKYCITKLSNNDIKLEKEKLPEYLVKDFEKKLDKLRLNAKQSLSKAKFKEYDVVELIVDNKYGIKKGSQGIVISDKAIKDYVDVDFSMIEGGELVGDIIAVNQKDLLLIKRRY